MRGLIILIFLASLSCKDQAPSEELVIWHAYRGQEKETLERLLKLYQERHGEAVRAVSIPFDALPNKVSAAVPRGNGPDLLIFNHDRIGGWAEKGLLEPLNFWAEDQLLDRFFVAPVESLVYRQALLGLPLNFKTLILYYDKSLVQTPPKTTAELLRQSQALRAQDETVWGLGYEVNSLYFHAPWLHAFGARVEFEEGGLLKLDKEKTAASMRFARELQRSIMPKEANSQLISALFMKHKLAFVLSGPWFRGELKEHSGWGVAQLPYVNGSEKFHEDGKPRRGRPYLGVEGLLMSAYSPHKERAFRLMRFLCEDEITLRRMKEGGQFVANKAAYQDEELTQNHISRAFQAQVEETVPLSSSPYMQRIWTPMQRALSLSIVDGKDPGAALDEVALRLRKAAE